MIVMSEPQAVAAGLRIYRSKPRSDTLIGMRSMRIFLKMQTGLDVRFFDRWSEDRLMERIFRRLRHFDASEWCDRLSSTASTALVQRRIVRHRGPNTPEHVPRCLLHFGNKCAKR